MPALKHSDKYTHITCYGSHMNSPSPTEFKRIYWFRPIVRTTRFQRGLKFAFSHVEAECLM